MCPAGTYSTGSGQLGRNTNLQTTSLLISTVKYMKDDQTVTCRGRYRYRKSQSVFGRQLMLIEDPILSSRRVSDIRVNVCILELMNGHDTCAWVNFSVECNKLFLHSELQNLVQKGIVFQQSPRFRFETYLWFLIALRSC